jgi:hypothetical protein
MRRNDARRLGRSKINASQGLRHAGAIHESNESFAGRTRRVVMYMVYWTVVDNETRYPHAKAFDSSDMLAAMRFMEELRTKQREGKAISFITMSSENPESVGHPGVAEPGPDYNWKKRRR